MVSIIRGKNLMAKFCAENFSAPKKKQLINGVVKDILVNYDQSKKLHRVRVNFRLPVLRSVGEILGANNAVLKRGGITPNTAETIENTGAPNHPRSTLLHCDKICSNGIHINGKDIEVNQYYLTLAVDYYSATLWIAPYSDYQQFLFDTIDSMHKEGNSYIKIAQWMNDNNHLTPRGSVFKPNHAWSIHMKKRKSIERFTRTFEPEITDIGIDIIP
jgi:hypothetical protein